MSTAQTQLNSIDQLTKSKGWAVVEEVMKEEIVSSAMSIADNPNMTLDEINFRRGSIWAAKRLLELPDRLKSKLTTDLALLSTKDTPAKAG
jgi:hypothetical protein